MFCQAGLDMNTDDMGKQQLRELLHNKHPQTPISQTVQQQPEFPGPKSGGGPYGGPMRAPQSRPTCEC